MANNVGPRPSSINGIVWYDMVAPVPPLGRGGPGDTNGNPGLGRRNSKALSRHFSIPTNPNGSPLTSFQLFNKLIHRSATADGVFVGGIGLNHESAPNLNNNIRPMTWGALTHPCKPNIRPPADPYDMTATPQLSPDSEPIDTINAIRDEVATQNAMLASVGYGVGESHAVRTTPIGMDGYNDARNPSEVKLRSSDCLDNRISRYQQIAADAPNRRAEMDAAERANS